MIAPDLLFIFVFALVLSSLLGWGFGWRHPARSDAVGSSVLFLFLILLLSMWAVGGWLPVRGPVLYGVPWLSLLVVGILISLLLLATAAPSRRPRTPSKAKERAAEAAVVGTAFGLFFWLLIIGLAIAIATHYLT